MKLTKKFQYYTHAGLIIVLSLGFVLNYYLFRYSIHQATDDVLREFKQDVEEFAAENDTIKYIDVLETLMQLAQLDLSTEDRDRVDESIKDTLIYSIHECEMVVYRKLEFPVKTATEDYVVKIVLPALEEDDLANTVIISLIVLLTLFSLSTSMMAWIFGKKILPPFFRTLNVMKGYDIEERKEISLEKSNIDEFNEMNHILTNMIEKINTGYDEMKDFLEHTSHEIKTPLAIMQLKLESLNQKENLDEETIVNIASMQSALSRIIRFNHSLLLIAKIKNNQFLDVEPVKVNIFLKQFIQFYAELIDAREIRVNYHVDAEFIADMDPVLSEQLVQNVLTNAVKHNVNGGFIDIHTSADEIKVTNTFKGKLPEGNLFEKYNYSGENKDSTGLGLTIVKNICVNNHLQVHYKVENDLFSIIVSKKIIQ